MEDQIFVSIDKFLSSYNDGLSDEDCLVLLDKFSCGLKQAMGMDDVAFSINWRITQNLFIEASTDTKSSTISFNLNRKKVFEKYKIQSSNPSFSEFIEKFKTKYVVGQDEQDDALMWTIENRGGNLRHLGSYKDIPLSYVVTTLHELRHNKQRKISESNRKDKYIFSFMMLYSDIRCGPFDLLLTPVEIDAWQFSNEIMSQYLTKRGMPLDYVKSTLDVLELSDVDPKEQTDKMWTKFLNFTVPEDKKATYDKILMHEKEIRKYFEGLFIKLIKLKGSEHEKS